MMKTEKPNIIKRIVGFSQFGLIAAIAVLLVFAAFVTPQFFTADSLTSTSANNSVFAILALGSVFVLLTGGIDISVGAILAVSGVAVTKGMTENPEISPLVWIIVAIFIGALCGLINGVLVGKFRMVPMIVTLGTMYIFRGLAFVISGGQWYFTHAFTKEFMAVSQKKILGLPAIVLWAVILFVLMALMLGYTKLGRRLYAVGTNKTSSALAGINEGNVKMAAYIICGAFAGLAGMLYSANYAMVNSDIGQSSEMTAIAICVLGGVSIAGGRGNLGGVAIAAVLMSVITGLLSMLPGFSVWQNFLQGVIIIIAVIVNIVNGRLTFRRALKEKEARI